MSGFSTDWLALREGADHRARDAGLAQRLAGVLDGRKPVRVIDLGSGTGSNLRATAPFLSEEQEWTLVDLDPGLLEEAARKLHIWADAADAIGDDLVLTKGRKRIGVHFRLADLAREVEDVLDRQADLVTASALFDLASAAWIERLVGAVATRGALFYTVLTYDGRDELRPAHGADHAVISAFAMHQRRDKGFGPAAGPSATGLLQAGFVKAGYAVATAASPWRLGASDDALAHELLNGMAMAVSETNAISEATLQEWLAFRQAQRTKAGAQVVTGHTDLLALKT